MLFNSNAAASNVTLFISPSNFNLGDFYPAQFQSALIRDLYLQRDMGVASDVFTAQIDAYDAMIIRVTPLL